ERRGRDSNPRWRFTPQTHLAGGRLQPLGHLSHTAAPAASPYHTPPASRSRPGVSSRNPPCSGRSVPARGVGWRQLSGPARRPSLVRTPDGSRGDGRLIPEQSDAVEATAVAAPRAWRMPAVWRQLVGLWLGSRVVIVLAGWLISSRLGWHRALEPWQHQPWTALTGWDSV